MLQLHVCISGFAQHPGRNHGMVQLSEHLLRTGFSSGARSRVWLHTWNSNWSQLAEHAWRLSMDDNDGLHVGIYAYSWGAGYGAIRFAKELGERGIRVRGMVLSDPVPRPFILWRWLAMLPGDWPMRPRVVIPHNVDEVYAFFQRQDLPQGCKPVATDKRTLVHPPVQIGCSHVYMDDAKPFHLQSLAMARTIRSESLCPLPHNQATRSA